MAVIIGYCSRCGSELVEDDEVCRCCGTGSIDANTVMVLKRISARRSLRDRRADSEEADDTIFPL